ncbi:MAG TPA: SDR family oxidoreductase [Candidatus Limnocylindria bacterium]|nr:SDR family oxidoreductase [Candidatus Limnocylindria bacterium]
MNQTALITGATSGIGLALAKVFAKNKYDVVLVARGNDELEKTKADLENQYHVKAYTIAKNLADSKAPREIFDFCAQKQIEIEILANNAGIATYGKFAETDLPQTLTMLDLNIRALTELTGLFLPAMLKRNSGKILNVASGAAFQPGPLWAVYAASKAYILSFSLAIRNELKGTNVFMTAVCPGSVKTNFQAATKGFNQTKLIKSGTKGKFMLKPEEVAQAAFKGLMKNRPYVVIGFINKLLAFGSKILPVSLTTAVSRWTLEK